MSNEIGGLEPALGGDLREDDPDTPSGLEPMLGGELRERPISGIQIKIDISPEAISRLMSSMNVFENALRNIPDALERALPITTGQPRRSMLYTSSGSMPRYLVDTAAEHEMRVVTFAEMLGCTDDQARRAIRHVAQTTTKSHSQVSVEDAARALAEIKEEDGE